MEVGKKCWILLFLLCMSSYAQCHSSKVVSVNHTNVTIVLTPGKSLDFPAGEMTLCFRFKVSREAMTEQRLLIRDSNENFLMQGVFSNQAGGIFGAEKSSIFSIPNDAVRPNQWNHMCLSMNQSNYWVVSNNVLWYEAITHVKIPNITSFWIGGKSKKLIWTRPFTGSFSEVNVWQKTLDVEVLKSITASCGKLQSDPELILWDKFQITPMSSLYEMDFCHVNERLTRVIATRLPYPADEVCDKLGAKMPKYQDMYGIHSYPKACRQYIQIPLKRMKNGTWIDTNTNEDVTDTLVWDSYQPNGLALQECAHINVQNDKILDIECSYHDCFACQWDKPVSFILKGLLDEDLDKQYTLDPTLTFNDHVVFMGDFKNFIVYNQSHWLIIEADELPAVQSIESGVILKGSLPTTLKSSYLPVGTNIWNIRDSSTKVALKLSKCHTHQFTCDDGLCIDLYQRCDSIYDCKDSSDEMDCDPIKYDPKTYKKILPPTYHNLKLEVHVQLDIKSISQVHEINEQFQSEVRILLQWYDPRLSFKDLTDSGNFLNEDWKELIWLPPLTFSNTFGNEPLLAPSAGVKINKEGQGSTKPYELYEGTYYNGSENSLILFGQYQHYFDCQFRLHSYPFDTQKCSIDIAVPLNLRDYISLQPLNVTFSGLKILPQFEILDDPFFSSTDNGSHLRAVFYLHRNPNYLIQAAYIPSIYIILMSTLTLYCMNDVGIGVTLVLTSLLCLYSLFQSVLSDVTKTAYLKYVDYWNIFTLGMLFVIYLALLINWTLDHNRKCRGANWIKSLLLWGIPILMIFFVSGYTIYATMLYFDQES